MKFRKLTELTDEEVSIIVNKVIRPKEIKSIKRLKSSDTIEISIITVWEDDEGESEVEEEIVLDYDGFKVDWYDHDMGKNDTICKKYLLAKGCNFLLKDNEWIEEKIK